VLVVFRVHPGWFALLVAATVTAATSAPAQVLDPLAERTDVVLSTLPSIGSAWDDRARVDQLLGVRSTAGYLLRGASTMLDRPDSDARRLRLELFVPEARVVTNSAIPFSLNDGSVWAGRGASRSVSFGLRAAAGPVSLVFAPELTRSENAEFEILPWPLYLGRPGRDPFGTLWYSEGGDIDLPYRFGDEPVHRSSLGQSTLEVRSHGVRLGVSGENQWWGPGIRNAIVMSNNAPGFAHAFLGTAEPLRTPIGDFEGQWILGGLRESNHYDTIPDNDLRSISGAVMTFSPAVDPNLTLGIARTVVGPAAGTRDALAHATRVFRTWERRPSVWTIDWEPATDQILSIFGRWVLPDDGAEVYFEWARHELPVSLRDMLLAPHHTQGYTLGAQYARAVPHGVLRFQAEHTGLEQSTTFKQRPFDPFYTGRAAPQGYTHLGQVVGAAIGPGSSSQWLAADLLGERGRIGVTASRIRWENDAFYRSPSPDPVRGHRSPHAHDVSVIGGLRGGVRVWEVEAGAEILFAHRYNYLFQNPDRGFGPEGAVDVWNRTIRIHLSPARRQSPGRPG
jgi:hypothetical protein